MVLAPHRPRWDDDQSALKTVFVDRRPAAKRLRRGRLIVVEGPGAGKQFAVQSERVRIGRSRVNDLTVDDPSVSAIHAELRLTDQGVLLRDLGSTNGTWFGQLRLGEAYIAAGMVFRVGKSSLRYEATDEVVEVKLSGVERFEGVLGRGVRMREIFATLEKVAPSDLTVLIHGDTGTGKELVAQAIHARSRRAQGPFVVVDCSALPPNLIESALFGHERGSFTGAVERRRGPFEEAAGGTVFLDEIGELPLSLQPKLLRVLENRELKRVGGSQTVHTDVRVLAATHRDLARWVAESRFRQDLYFRLSVVRVELPPLRERVEDIPLLLDAFLSGVHNPRLGDGGSMTVAPAALGRLCLYSWPGNVRELRNMVERAVTMADSSVLGIEDFFPRSGGEPLRQAPEPPRTATLPASVDPAVPFKEAKRQIIEQFEREYLGALMARPGSNISRAARATGLTRYHLRELLKKHGLAPGP